MRIRELEEEGWYVAYTASKKAQQEHTAVVITCNCMGTEMEAEGGSVDGVPENTTMAG